MRIIENSTILENYSSLYVESIDTKIVSIGVNSYIDKLRDVEQFLECCKACDNYNKNWSCPPFNINFTKELLKYNRAYIIGTRINIKEEMRSITDESNHVIESILIPIRKELDKELLKLELKTPNSRAFFAGSCKKCEDSKCTRILGLPCKFPLETRPSLEAIGFDMGRTASEILEVDLKWSSGNRLPEYFMLISAIFLSE